VEKVRAQNFKNHARLVPPFHFFVLPVFMINLIYSLVRLKDGITFSSVWSAVMALALVMAAVLLRVMALTVQDRIIRLEMQVRLERLLAAELRPRIGEFTLDQLVGLRFAGDDELPVLARQVLDEKLTDRKIIKQRVKDWRPDFLRA
jgi:Family of unknown function (DUF6526)